MPETLIAPRSRTNGAPLGRTAAAPAGAAPAPARPATAADLVVAGMTPLSTVDWPGRLAATVFLQGCPWRCTYCHNPGLRAPRPQGALPWGSVRSLLERRHGLLDGIVFSGGEPTMQRGLLPAIEEVKAMGFAVGLHTGGPWPRRLEPLLPHLDWVGLDIKHLPGRYPALTGAAPSGPAAWESLAAVQRSGVTFEVRTTVDPTLHTREELLELGDRLRELGVRKHVLQEVRPDGTCADYVGELAGRRLRDVLRDTDLPWVERRLAS